MCFDVILLTEYHSGSIRLRRVILLRSVIRLTPSDIRFASLEANRISLKPQGFNITVAVRQYHSLRRQRISLIKRKKERALRNFVSALLSLLFLSPVSQGLICSAGKVSLVRKVGIAELTQDLVNTNRNRVRKIKRAYEGKHGDTNAFFVIIL